MAVNNAEQIKSLKDDISALKNDLNDVVQKQVEDKASNSNSKLKISSKDLQTIANNAGKQVKEFIANTSKNTIESKQKCESAIKKRPFASAAIAFAGGALIASLFINRNK